jgi:hypothetical protein
VGRRQRGQGWILVQVTKLTRLRLLKCKGFSPILLSSKVDCQVCVVAWG